MKAIIYDNAGPPRAFKLAEIEKPTAGDDEVLINVRAASVNPLDVGLLRHPFLRRIVSALSKLKNNRPGRDVAGHVEAVGRNVTHFKPGDAVFGWCGGAFAEYARTSQSKLVMKPDNASFEQAAAVPVAALTALQGLRDRGKIQPGQEAWVRSLCKSPSHSALRLPAFAVRGTLKWSDPSAQITSLITPERTSRKVDNTTI